MVCHPGLAVHSFCFPPDFAHSEICNTTRKQHVWKTCMSYRVPGGRKLAAVRPVWLESGDPDNHAAFIVCGSCRARHSWCAADFRRSVHRVWLYGMSSPPLRGNTAGEVAWPRGVGRGSLLYPAFRSRPRRGRKPLLVTCISWGSWQGAWLTLCVAGISGGLLTP